MTQVIQGTLGNIHSYKTYTRPTAQRLYGKFSYRKQELPKHHENIQRMLHVLAIKGPLTTWGMAKVELVNELSKVRTREKQYRKFLMGREDRCKHSPGVLEVGLVIEVENKLKTKASIYRLSIHGILYCLDVLDLSNKEIDMMAKNYQKVLPKIFGKWEYLKKALGNDAYRIKLLAKGFLLDNVQTTKISRIPVYEILAYLSTKYLENYENIEEEKLAEQISCWYFTQLFISNGTNKQISSKDHEIWYRSISDDDTELRDWYQEFLDEVTRFYEDRFEVIKQLKNIDFK